MNKVVLLTKHYPYDHGEEFIEQEIEYLTEVFDEILIIATSVTKTTQTREVPKKVIVYAITDYKTPILRYVKHISRSFFLRNMIFRSGLKKESGLKKRLANRYVYARARVNAARIYGMLQSRIEEKDSVIFYSYWFGDLTLSGIMLSRMFLLKRTCIVSRAHGYDLYADRNIAGHIPYAEYILDNANCVLPCSHDGTNYIKNRWHSSKKKVKTSYLGTIDYGYRDDHGRMPFVIVTCSGITEVKRVKLAAEALTKVNRVNKRNLLWICIGAGPLLDMVKEYTNKNLTDVKVEFKGRISNKEVIQLYKNNRVNLFLNTSSSEGIPVSIMEAISFGTPIIATDVGGTSEIVIDGVTGYLLSKNPSPEAIAAKINYFIEMSDEKYKTLCKSTRSYWVDNFNAETNYTKFASQLNELIIR